jgi:hypothetical protein
MSGFLRPSTIWLIIAYDLPSTVTSGENLGNSGESYIDVLERVSVFVLTVVYSIVARPLNPIGNRFGFGIAGQNFDPIGLAQPEKVKEFFHTETGRTELKFGDFSCLSYFKYIFSTW